MSEVPTEAMNAAEALWNAGYLYLGIEGHRKPMEGAARIIAAHTGNRGLLALTQSVRDVYAKRLEVATKLLDKQRHINVRGWCNVDVQDSETWECAEDCPACAWEKYKKTWTP